MKVGDTVWTGNWGNVRKCKLIAIDGENAAIRWPSGEIHGEGLEDLHETKAAATAAALEYRKKNLKEELRRLNEAVATVQKTLHTCVESLDAMDDE